ncbi:MAG: hypothetical protein QM784_06020 [Polyangiaceae bacterium]
MTHGRSCGIRRRLRESRRALAGCRNRTNQLEREPGLTNDVSHPLPGSGAIGHQEVTRVPLGDPPTVRAA